MEKKKPVSLLVNGFLLFFLCFPHLNSAVFVGLENV